MKIRIINGRVQDNSIHTSESTEWIRKEIESCNVVIVRGAFDRARILETRKRVHEFGNTTPEGNPERSADTIAFHRIDDNHPKMAVKRIAHFFRFSYSHKSTTGVFNFFEPMNFLRNEIAGLPRNYTFYEDHDGYLSQPAVLQYPSGGGYLQAHVDPVYPQYVEMVLAASKRGIDFESGGISAHNGTEWVDIEEHVEVGDLVLFKPDILHRVDPIDSGNPVDWTSERGRWIFFSPIANIKNQSVNEKARY